MRHLTKYSTLYTEMINVNAILNYRFFNSIDKIQRNGYKELLQYYPCEHPVVVQLGGSDLDSLAKCCKICEQEGYDEINLNVGCPSPKGTNLPYNLN